MVLKILLTLFLLWNSSFLWPNIAHSLYHRCLRTTQILSPKMPPRLSQNRHFTTNAQKLSPAFFSTNTLSQLKSTLTKHQSRALHVSSQYKHNRFDKQDIQLITQAFQDILKVLSFYENLILEKEQQLLSKQLSPQEQFDFIALHAEIHSINVNEWVYFSLDPHVAKSVLKSAKGMRPSSPNERFFKIHFRNFWEVRIQSNYSQFIKKRKKAVQWLSNSRYPTNLTLSKSEQDEIIAPEFFQGQVGFSYTAESVEYGRMAVNVTSEWEKNHNMFMSPLTSIHHDYNHIKKFIMALLKTFKLVNKTRQQQSRSPLDFFSFLEHNRQYNLKLLRNLERQNVPHYAFNSFIQKHELYIISHPGLSLQNQTSFRTLGSFLSVDLRVFPSEIYSHIRDHMTDQMKRQGLNIPTLSNHFFLFLERLDHYERTYTNHHRRNLPQ